MSLIPMLFSNWWEELDHPHHLLDQNFGLCISPDQLRVPANRMELYLRPRDQSSYIRPWAELLRQAESGMSTVQADKDKFQVSLDVQQFKPEEIDVKVADNYVIINAKHEEKRDEHGWISRQFTRKYLIPEQCDIDQVTSKLSSDGILSITAPRKDVPKAENERTIKIEHTGKPAIQEKQKPKESIEAKEKSSKK